MMAMEEPVFKPVSASMKKTAYAKSVDGVLQEFRQVAADKVGAQKFVDMLATGWWAIPGPNGSYFAVEMSDWDLVMGQIKTKFPEVRVPSWFDSQAQKSSLAGVEEVRSTMIKYSLDWWRMIVYWKLHLFMGFLMTPCLPMRIADGIDRIVFGYRRRVIMDFYDTWTMRLHVILYGKWADLCYGKQPERA